jgi:hypothetical protein
MAKPNRYASIAKQRSETAGQTQRGIATSAKRRLLDKARKHLEEGKSLNPNADGAYGAVLKAEGLI